MTQLCMDTFVLDFLILWVKVKSRQTLLICFKQTTLEVMIKKSKNV